LAGSMMPITANLISNAALVAAAIQAKQIKISLAVMRFLWINTLRYNLAPMAAAPMASKIHSGIYQASNLLYQYRAPNSKDKLMLHSPVRRRRWEPVVSFCPILGWWLSPSTRRGRRTI
jgi:hypothetical protein